MESITTPGSMESDLFIASGNRLEIRRALAEINNGELSDLQDDLKKIPGGVIDHPFGYYKIPMFASTLEEIENEVPIRLVDDGDEMWKKHNKVFGYFDGTSACIKTSDFDLRNKILTAVCGDWEQMAVEQAIEHEIRHGLITNYMNLWRASMDEGFATSTYIGFHGLAKTKNWQSDPDYLRDIFLAAQEKGTDDVKIVERLSQLLEPGHYPQDEWKEYQQGRNAINIIISEIGADRPTDKYLLTRKNNWEIYRHRVYEITKKKLESKGGLKLKTLNEIVVDYA